MRIHLKYVLIPATAILLTAGCKKTADNTENYKSAINSYLSSTPSCLWTSEQKFPMQVGSSDDSKNAPFAALVDAGLLTRTTSEKKIIIISKQETNYDLSDKGRSAWTSDPVNPGYGNFCYGHRSVQSISGATPTTGQPGATTQVTYTYGFSGAPDWAKSSETQNAFPPLQTDLAGGTGSATLLDTNDGWKVQGPPPTTPSNNMTPSAGRIVQ
jgi:hypothetical protein